MKITKFKIFKIADEDMGIWIPKDEIARMIVELYKVAINYDKKRAKTKDSAYHAAMLKAQGGAELLEYLYKQFELKQEV